ncbi:uncharacterized protein LOC135127281 isoform X1 [Zophobas morio]|uniref:uncharacterized protein LOC135127281 isoform X1 n=1 Tax=Zophobas morio TaxID=2755281 RepID=UPI003082B93F
MKISSILCALVALAVHAAAQLPPRLNIPGAVLVGQARPAPFRNNRVNGDSPPPLRLRRPPPPINAAPAPIRPVVEEPEEGPSTPSPGHFDDEVTKLGISALQSAVRQASGPEEDNQRPVHFRPERPIPVLRESIRDSAPAPRPTPPLRQEPRENVPRPLLRQEPREEGPPLRQPQPVRHAQVRQQIPIQAPQPVRQPTRSHPARQPSQYLDEDGHNGRPGRTRKPPVQILRKYRTDNPDGSITWGFENEDGTFKEETLGTDCITRGKYGYVDPDGVRRQYSYETGNKCDEPEEEEQLLPERPQVQLQPRKPPQFRPPPGGQF